jgi:hypothetical protein
MEKLAAANNPIIVVKASGATSGSTTVSYEKERDEALFEKVPGGTWAEVNVHVRTGLGDVADRAGSYVVTLKPGQIYEAWVSDRANGPLSADPLPQAVLKLFCLWDMRTDLITDKNSSTGGTWHAHQIATSRPTSLVAIGASRKPPVTSGIGPPVIVTPDGGPAAPTGVSMNHLVQLLPLLPGNHYFFTAVVADAGGEWDVLNEEFDTLRRKLTVEFPTIHIFNDGDPFDHGEGEFWFRVYAGTRQQPNVIQDFHLPTQDIDDWGETDRPYSVGFAHLGAPETVKPGREGVLVGSWGVEHDGALESDEGAGGDATLPLPAGRFVETVLNSTFRMDCPVTTTDDDFHYGVDVKWSVEYVP